MCSLLHSTKKTRLLVSPAICGFLHLCTYSTSWGVSWCVLYILLLIRLVHDWLIIGSFLWSPLHLCLEWDPLHVDNFYSGQSTLEVSYSEWNIQSGIYIFWQTHFLSFCSIRSHNRFEIKHFRCAQSLDCQILHFLPSGALQGLYYRCCQVLLRFGVSGMLESEMHAWF